jgi:hypothetical protein
MLDEATERRLVLPAEGEGEAGDQLEVEHVPDTEAVSLSPACRHGPGPDRPGLDRLADGGLGHTRDRSRLLEREAGGHGRLQKHFLHEGVICPKPVQVLTRRNRPSVARKSLFAAV